MCDNACRVLAVMESVLVCVLCWLDAVHLWLNNVHQASVYSLMLRIRHQYGSVLCIRHRNGTIWLNAVQALIYDPMMYIRHHNVAQTCASCTSKAIDP